MEHRLTLTGLQDAVGARKAGGLDVIYTKLAVDLQNLAGGAADPVLAAAIETLRDETACDAVAVILLDELDKVGVTAHGQEVTNVLIHLTDTTQNDVFSDHYFNDVPIDFSNALLVFTYNDGAAINPVLRDRMVRIKTAGYSLADKQVIATKHLLPEVCAEHGYGRDAFRITPSAVAEIVARVEKEAGVRNLKRAVQDIVSNVNLKCYLEGGDRDEKVDIDSALIRKYVADARPDNASVSHIYC